MEEIFKKILTPLLQMENLIRLLYVERQIKKNKGVFESPIPLSVTFKDAKKIDIQNAIIGNLLSQINASKISDAKVKQILNQTKDQEFQDRLDELRKRIDLDEDDNNSNNNNSLMIATMMMMMMITIIIIMMEEKNNVEDTISQTTAITTK